MSDQFVSPSSADSASRSRRGQTLVEFALVLPMLIVLLLGIADFGRVFQAGITLEAVARDAAEVGALQRLRDKPDFTDASLHPAYYTSLHQVVARTACAESEQLAVSPEQVDATDCPRLTAVRVCVHDNLDPQCGSAIPGFAGAVPAECSDTAVGTAPAWSNYNPGEVTSHWVEVRVCYHFTTLFNLHLSLPLNAGLSLGDVYLQKTRSFVLDCPPAPALVATC